MSQSCCKREMRCIRKAGEGDGDISNLRGLLGLGGSTGNPWQQPVDTSIGMSEQRGWRKLIGVSFRGNPVPIVPNQPQ